MLTFHNLQTPVVINSLERIFKYLIISRKFSCVNARGTPPAAQQVFAVLICPGSRGQGVPTLAGRRGTYPGWGEGVPTLAGGHLPWPGGGGNYPGQGKRGTYFGQGKGYLPRLGGGGTYYGQGVPNLAEGKGTYPGWGTPPPGCEKTGACENSTFPHSSDVGDNNT